jgi:HK97 family phage portal protein
VSLFRRHQRLFGINGAQDLIPGRSSSGVGSVPVTTDSAMRHSAVWACLRLRADLISTMPVDSFRKLGAIDVAVKNSPVLVTPGGEHVGIQEWLYSTQVDLDRAGNAFGLITERNASNKPIRIDLVPIAAVTVMDRSGVVSYRIDGKTYDREKVWHEKQYTVPGLPVGLSPIAYAAWTIGQYQSAQQFALAWFSSGGTPKGHMQNTALASLPAAEAAIAKERFTSAIRGGDVLVSGKDWEYKPFHSEAVGAEWLATQEFGIADVARFLGVPGDLIDAPSKGGSITYANITQRNLQFLIMNLGPAIIRRETALSTLLSSPRFVKLNTSALLRMDDAARAQVIKTRIESRTMTPTEARQKDLNLPPLTEAQYAEFDRLWGKGASAPVLDDPATTKEPV